MGSSSAGTLQCLINKLILLRNNLSVADALSEVELNGRYIGENERKRKRVDQELATAMQEDR